MTMAKSMPEMEEYKYGFRDEHKADIPIGKRLTRGNRTYDFGNEKRAGMDA